MFLDLYKMLNFNIEKLSIKNKINIWLFNNIYIYNKQFINGILFYINSFYNLQINSIKTYYTNFWIIIYYFNNFFWFILLNIIIINIFCWCVCYYLIFYLKLKFLN